MTSPNTREQRFWARVEVQKDGCWLWTGYTYKRSGYGRVGVYDKIVLAHRYSYELLIGPIPDGLVLDHTCHTRKCELSGPQCPHRKCVNPGRLEPVTFIENVRRGNGAASRTHCPAGHEYSGENLIEGIECGYKARRCKECKNSMARAAYKRRREANRMMDSIEGGS